MAFEIRSGIYLGCLIPGGNSAHNNINSANQQAYIKRKHTQKSTTQKKGRQEPLNIYGRY